VVVDWVGVADAAALSVTSVPGAAVNEATTVNEYETPGVSPDTVTPELVAPDTGAGWLPFEES
jgi:hypothetical protein